MEHIERMGRNALVPVVVLEDASQAVATGEALLAGGIDVMEITLRTAAGVESIRAAADGCPGMLVGAGTVLNIEQAKAVAEAGAKFVVSPGFDETLVTWCIRNHIAIIPGCVTPTEIMAAVRLGLKVVKFFPANVYGGLTAMKALAGPFGDIKFIPTGGVNGQNIGEYTAAPFVHTVGGSWVCAKSDISAGNYDKITRLCQEAVTAALGYEVVHVGINGEDEEEAERISGQFQEAFGWEETAGKSSIFSSRSIEVLKSRGRGKMGHLAVQTNRIERAIFYLEKKGYTVDRDSAKYKDGQMTAVYLREEMGGFAVHLLQK